MKLKAYCMFNPKIILLIRLISGALACSGLKQGFGSQPEIEVGPWQ